MNKLRITALFLGLGAALVACDRPDQKSELSWGHLQDQSLNPNTPQYLINKKASDVYRVCVAQYMIDELPGVEAEIKAAINVWASYLGRSIQVETIVKDLPRAVAGDRTDTLQTSYYNVCGNDVDVVMGFAPFGGSTVGQTGVSWRGYSNEKVISFKRHLFLRDYKISPDGYGTQRWVSLQELSQTPSDSANILTSMQARNRQEVAPTATSIALPVLVHEFGHVWGLCDQYEGPSNCDPNFKSPHPDLQSIMAASSNLAKIYLTDDDITGIRALANRAGFNAAWPGTETALSQEPQALALAEISYFKLKSVQKDGTKFKLNFGLITTNKGGELRIEYRLKGSGNWQQLPSYFPSNDAFMIPDYALTQTLRSDVDYEFRLSLRLLNDDKSFASPVYAQL